MPKTRYDVSARGQKCTIPVDVGDAAVGGRLMLRKATENSPPNLIDVTLSFEVSGGDATELERIAIRSRDHIIGHLTAERTSEYSQIRRIVASGLVPSTVARVRAAGSGRSSGYDVSISLRPANDIIPVNAPPDQPWALLPSGNIMQVTREKAHADYLGMILPSSGRTQALATLHKSRFGVRKKYDGIEVRIGGKRVGELTRPMGEKMLPAVDHYSELGLQTVARAFITGSKAASEVTLECARAAELSDEDLEPTISPIPRLLDFQEDASRYALLSDGNPTAKKIKPVAARSRYTRAFQPADSPPVPIRTSPTVRPKPSPVRPTIDERSKKTVDYVPNAANAAPTSSAEFTRSNSIGNVVLWLVAAVGALVFAGALTSGERLMSAIGSGLIGLAILAAASWALICRSADDRTLAKWSHDDNERRRLASLLTPADSLVLAGMQPVAPPERKRRRWGAVAPTLGALSIAGMVMGSAGTPTATATDPAVTATVTESRTVTTTTTESSSISSTSSTTSSATRALSSGNDAIPYDEENETRTREPDAPRAAYVPNPARPTPTPTYTPRETYAPPANTGGGTYPNCSAARAAGAAPVYIGSPGYGPHLDRDGDGVGCE